MEYIYSHENSTLPMSHLICIIIFQLFVKYLCRNCDNCQSVKNNNMRFCYEFPSRVQWTAIIKRITWRLLWAPCQLWKMQIVRSIDGIIHSNLSLSLVHELPPGPISPRENNNQIPQISPSLGPTRLIVMLIRSSWNYAGVPTALLQRRLHNSTATPQR